MSDKRCLFRGFHPDDNGKTKIMCPTLNNVVIKGRWIYGDLMHNGWKDKYIHPHGNSFDVSNSDLTKLLVVHKVIPETIGQWVATDKNGKDVFEGDEVSHELLNGKFEVEYNTHTCMYLIRNL